VEAVAHALTTAGALVTLEATDRFADIGAMARKLAESREHDAIVAAGGDGTMRAAATPLLGTGVALGIIPVGTANVLATEIGLPRTAVALADVLMHGPTATVSCGLVDGSAFLLMASAGFDAAVLQRLDPALKRNLGKLAFAGPILKELGRPPHPFEVLIDGVAHRCSWLIVTNARHYAGRFVLSPQRALTAPGFDAVLITAATRPSLLRVLAAIALGRVAHIPEARIIACRTVGIDAALDIPIQIDGDASPRRGLSIGETKAPLELIVPPTSSP
jgi:diacylglycerol kinase (ATP)